MVLLMRPSSTLLWLHIENMTFDFATQLTSSHLLSKLMNENLECKDRQIYSKMLRMIYKKEV